MKQIVTLFSFLFLFSLNTSAQVEIIENFDFENIPEEGVFVPITEEEYQASINISEANIYIAELKTNKVTYKQGEDITFSVSVDNSAGFLQSDMYVETSFSKDVDGTEIDFSREIQDNNFFVDANSRRTEMYTTKVTNEISGNISLVVAVYLSDGSLFGYKKTPIEVIGNEGKDVAIFSEAFVRVGGEEFGLQVGPTVQLNDSMELVFSMSGLDREYTVSPVLNIYNRTAVGTPIKSINLNNLKIGSDGQIIIDLPTDLGPMVYEAEIVFNSSEVHVPSLRARYIVYGPIATVINASSDVVSGNKGDIVTVDVQYAGTPVPINTDEELILDQIAELEVNILDIDDSIVGVNRVNINLSEFGSYPVPVVLESSVNGFKIKVVITSEGNVLDTYLVDMPSEEELSAANPERVEIITKTSLVPMIIVIMGVLLLVVLVSLLIRYRNNKKMVNVLSILVFGVAVASAIYGQRTIAQVELHYNPSANKAGYFRINSVMSPAPASSLSYSPGEEFNLEMSANFVACGNAGLSSNVYAFGQDWTNTTFDIQEVKDLLGNAFGYIGDYWGFVNNSKIANWWIDNKNGSHVWSSVGKSNTGSWGAGGHEYTVRYTIDTPHAWTTPSEPGFYKFYFFLRNDAHGNTASGKIASQTICVSGAGICPNEEPLICSNIIGDFTETDGIVYDEFGNLTNYILNEDGTCSEMPPVPSISCSVTPSSVSIGDNVTFTANAENFPVGIMPSYEWREDGVVKSTNSTYTTSYSSVGNKYTDLVATLGSDTYTDLCVTQVNYSVCSETYGDSCINSSFCPGKDIEGTYSCDGTTCRVPVGTTCDDEPPVTSTCPLLPEYVTSATYNLFNKDGIFTMTNPATGDVDWDLFNDFFVDYFDTTDVNSPVSAYNAGNGELVDIEIVNGIIRAGFPISGLVNADCSATLCSLNPNDYGSVDGSNTACSILKQGQSLTTTNGCYNPLGDTSTGKLLVSPNYMEPGEACSITWCAQGIDIANCALFVGGTEVGNIKGRGLSGTASFLMPTGDNAKSQTVQLICQDDANATVVQRVGSCKLDPNWTQF